jgi:hypothetical protein
MPRFGVASTSAQPRILVRIGGKSKALSGFASGTTRGRCTFPSARLATTTQFAVCDTSFFTVPCVTPVVTGATVSGAPPGSPAPFILTFTVQPGTGFDPLATPPSTATLNGIPVSNIQPVIGEPVPTFTAPIFSVNSPGNNVLILTNTSATGQQCASAQFPVSTCSCVLGDVSFDYKNAPKGSVIISDTNGCIDVNTMITADGEPVPLTANPGGGVLAPVDLVACANFLSITPPGCTTTSVAPSCPIPNFTTVPLTTFDVTISPTGATAIFVVDLPAVFSCTTGTLSICGQTATAAQTATGITFTVILTPAQVSDFETCFAELPLGTPIGTVQLTPSCPLTSITKFMSTTALSNLSRMKAQLKNARSVTSSSSTTAESAPIATISSSPTISAAVATGAPTASSVTTASSASAPITTSAKTGSVITFVM